MSKKSNRVKYKMILPTEELGSNVWELAVQRARQLYAQFDQVAVSFSGGKDSTATLHAVLAAAHEKPEERLPVRVIFFDEEAIPLETVDYVRRISQRDDVALEWYCVPIACGNACSPAEPFWYPWAPEAKHKWVRELPPEAITDFPLGYEGLNDPSKRVAHYDAMGLILDPATEGETVQALGIRAAESLRRHQAVTRREKDNWIVEAREVKNKRGAMWRAYPIYDWGDDDVWTAPQQFGWDYNRAYDMLEMLGVPPEGQRMGPPFGQEPLGGLWQWKHCYPQVWDKMVNRVPGAATAARYANSELYSYRSYPKKRDDQTWPERIVELLERHAPETRKQTAKQLAKWIRHHKAKTDDPIAPTKPHPATGLSWDYMAMVALRGDRMSRKDASSRRVDKADGYAKSYAVYEEEVNELRKQGKIKDILA